MTLRTGERTGTASVEAPAARLRTAGRSVPSAVPAGVWLSLMALLALWVAARLGLFSPTALVETAGGTVRLPDAFAGVDHPFHAARAETLRRALADGHPLRWVGHHQGGYPVEFYPLGVAWVTVAVWALGFGVLPMPEAHTLVVGLVFLLPGVAFALMAWRDRLPLGVALVAFAAHVAVPGGWWHGGYTELVQWGLATNVAAAVALLFVLPWLTAFLVDGRGRVGAGGALAAAFAIATNPRSLVALAVVGVAAWAVAVIPARRREAAVPPALASRRLATVAVLTGCLAAPVLVSLLRFADLYDFVRYESYANLGEYLLHAVAAVSPPVFALGAGGVVLAWLVPGGVVARAASVALVLYAAVTVALVSGPGGGGNGFVPQLEATRLMPFQRLLTIYLAAVALHGVARRTGAVLGGRGAPFVADGAALAAVAALLLAWVGDARAGAAVPEPYGTGETPSKGLYGVVGSARPEQADFLAAAAAADAAAPPGTAVLVLGSALSWHQRLWAPLETERPVFYDNWLWYWHLRHDGPPGYEALAGHHYARPDLGLALAPDYLADHGIGGVAVTDPVREAAAASSLLEPVRTGAYDVYAVREPTTLVTFAGENATVSQGGGGQRLAAAGRSAGGEAWVRLNWFPRWRATVNGEPVPIARAADNTMRVPIPAGEARLELVYGVDGFDWMARGLGLLGVVGSGWLAIGGRFRRRRRRGWTAAG